MLNRKQLKKYSMNTLSVAWECVKVGFLTTMVVYAVAYEAERNAYARSDYYRNREALLRQNRHASWRR